MINRRANMNTCLHFSNQRRFTLNVNKKMLPLNQLVSGGELENGHLSPSKIALGVVMACKTFIVHLLWSSQRMELMRTSQPQPYSKRRLRGFLSSTNKIAWLF